jgi:membrane protein DedA with SNARE-associated domain
VDVLSPRWIPGLIQAYGLWALFVLVMLESAGVPLPGETALLSAGLYAGSTHQIDIVAVVLAAAAAAIVGDNIGYLVGRSLGVRLVARYGKYVRLTEPRIRIGRYLFLQHGGKIVFFGRFVAFLRTFAALLAGVNRMRWSQFLLMNAVGGICWAVLTGGAAYLFGEEMTRAAGPIRLLLLIAAIGLTAVGIVFFRRQEKELERRATAAFEGSASDARVS